MERTLQTIPSEKIHFAHRTFAWESEARGKAHVHVVIVGFGAFDVAGKLIYDYDPDSGKVAVVPAKNISPYLIEGNDIVIVSRSSPLSQAPPIVFGSMPNDGGHLILSDEEKMKLLREEPRAAQFIRPFLGAVEFIHSQSRWCIWLKGTSPAEIRGLPRVMDRINGVRKHREESSRNTTRELATTPTLFGEIRQPDKRYLLIPSVSSENRKYVPMGFMPPSVIASNLVLLVPEAEIFHFGVLSSSMHMSWMRQVCGRLESRYRYSNKLVYNNFPWPEAPTAKQRLAVETAAQDVLDGRTKFPDASLADLYDPLSMPPDLVKAHTQLDRAIDLCYRPQPFENDRQRVEYLFALYEKLTAPLIPVPPKRRRKAASR